MIHNCIPKPNCYYLISSSLSKARLVNQQYVILIDGTGNLEKDILYKHRGKWSIETDHSWLDLITELTGFHILKEWDNKDDMLADMFVEIM